MKRLIAAIGCTFLAAACAAQPSVAPAASPTAPVEAASQAAAGGPHAFESEAPGDALMPGTYVLHYASIGGADGFPTLAFTFEVPAGWSRVEIDGAVWGEAGTRLRFLVADNLYTDPCDPSQGLREPAVGPSVADLASALATVAGWRVDSSSPGSYHGFDGSRVVMSGPPDVSSCGDGGSRLLHVHGSPDFALGDTDSEQHDLRVIDVAGTRAVIDAITTRDATPEGIAGLQAIVDSIQIEP